MPKQTPIMSEGDTGTEMYIVLDGLVQLESKGTELGKMRSHDVRLRSVSAVFTSAGEGCRQCETEFIVFLLSHSVLRRNGVATR